MECKGYNCYHSINIQQRVSDVDVLGHINNGVQQHYYDLARLSYFADVIGVKVDESDDSVVIANINLEFEQPIYFRTALQVFSKVIRIGNKSLKMVQFIVDRSSGTIKSWNSNILVGYRPAHNTTISIPEEWRNKIDVYEKDLNLCV